MSILITNNNIALTAPEPSTGVDYTQDAFCAGAYYMNGEGSGDEIDRANSNDLSCDGATIPRSATVPNGYSGYSRDVTSDGDQFILSNPHGLELTGTALTIALWIRLDSGAGSWRFLMGNYTLNDDRQYAMYVTNTDFFNFAVSTDGTNIVSEVGTTSVTADGTVWYHVAGVYDGANLNLYVNGELEGTQPSITNSLPDVNGDFAVGSTAVNGHPSDGLFDEVIIFSRALSIGEISDIYTNGIDGTNGGSDI